MSVLHVTRLWRKGESGDFSSETHHYRVQVSNLNDTIRSVWGAVDPVTSMTLPVQGALLAGTAWRAKITYDRNPDDPTIIDATVVYSAPEAGKFEDKPDGGEKWNKRISGRGIVYSEEVWKARDGTPVHNAAGDRFQNGVMHDYYDEEFVVEFNAEATDFDLDAAAECRGKLNADEITLTVKGTTRFFAVETLKCVDIDWSHTLEFTDNPNQADLNVRMVFHYREPGPFLDDPNCIGSKLPWAVRKVNEGFNRYVSTQTDTGAKRLTLEPITDLSGKPVDTPQFLDENGQLLIGINASPDIILIGFDDIEAVSFDPILAGV